jgi:CubicO group peptidase (beta-lactamase class C family)
MRILKLILKSLLVLIVLAIVGLYVSGNGHVLKGLRSTYLIGRSMPDIDDKDYFETSTIKADKPEPWGIHKRYGFISLNPEEEQLHEQYKSTAFLVIHKDSILFEKYWEGTDETTVTNSFSMAKSMTGSLIGVAIREGYIQSVDQKVGDFLPEFKEGKGAELTIKHLLQMASGIPFGESYGNPFGFMARAYFGGDLVEETMKFSVTTTPGEGWVYEGGNTILLGMILKKATGRTVSEYFHQKIWSCIGAENDAYWNLDNYKGMEKVFSGFYATARDFAKFGKLYEHNGILGPDTIVPPAFVKESITPGMMVDITPEKSQNEKNYWYGYQTWLGEYKGHDYFSFRGLRGQYVIIIPELEMIVVRIGHLQSNERLRHMPIDLEEYVAMGERIIDAAK